MNKAFQAHIDELEQRELHVHGENIKLIKHLRELAALIDQRWADRPHISVRAASDANGSHRKPRIVNLDQPAEKVTVAIAIREAISAQNGEFRAADISDYVRKRHPNLKIKSGTVSKRLYQFRRSGEIELASAAKIKGLPHSFHVTKK